MNHQKLGIASDTFHGAKYNDLYTDPHAQNRSQREEHPITHIMANQVIYIAFNPYALHHIIVGRQGMSRIGVYPTCHNWGVGQLSCIDIINYQHNSHIIGVPTRKKEVQRYGAAMRGESKVHLCIVHNIYTGQVRAANGMGLGPVMVAVVEEYLRLLEELAWPGQEKPGAVFTPVPFLTESHTELVEAGAKS